MQLGTNFCLAVLQYVVFCANFFHEFLELKIVFMTAVLQAMLPLKNEECKAYFIFHAKYDFL